MNLDEPKFLTLAEVLYLHDESLAARRESASRDWLNPLWVRRKMLFDMSMVIYLKLPPLTPFTLPSRRRSAMATNEPPRPQPFHF
jgi:hypothetical protein